MRPSALRRASPNVNMRWRWIEISPTPIPLSDLVRFLSVAPKKQRLTLARPCASVRAIRWLTSGCISRAWRRTTSAVTSKRSRGFDGRSRPTEIIRLHISSWPPPSRSLVDSTRRIPQSRPARAQPDLHHLPRPRRLDGEERRPDVPGRARAHSRRPAQGRGSRTMTAARRLAAILAADSVGYSRLMGEDEAGTTRPTRMRAR